MAAQATLRATGKTYQVLNGAQAFGEWLVEKILTWYVLLQARHEVNWLLKVFVFAYLPHPSYPLPPPLQFFFTFLRRSHSGGIR